MSASETVGAEELTECSDSFHLLPVSLPDLFDHTVPDPIIENLDGGAIQRSILIEQLVTGAMLEPPLFGCPFEPQVGAVIFDERIAWLVQILQLLLYTR